MSKFIIWKNWCQSFSRILLRLFTNYLQNKVRNIALGLMRKIKLTRPYKCSNLAQVWIDKDQTTNPKYIYIYIYLYFITDQDKVETEREMSRRIKKKREI